MTCPGHTALHLHGARALEGVARVPEATSSKEADHLQLKPLGLGHR